MQGALIVSTPQKVALDDASKGIDMYKKVWSTADIFKKLRFQVQLIIIIIPDGHPCAGAVAEHVQFCVLFLWLHHSHLWRRGARSLAEATGIQLIGKSLPNQLVNLLISRPLPNQSVNYLIGRPLPNQWNS